MLRCCRFRPVFLTQGCCRFRPVFTVALREHFSERDAAGKAKKTLSRIWLNPPEDAKEMISWAIDNPQEFPDRRLMHCGALLATFPFVGSILADLGRQFVLDEPLTVVELRRRAEARWGGSSTVWEGVGKAVTTLRRLRIVDGGGRKPIAPTPRLECTPAGSEWLTHAAMLTRRIGSLDTHEASLLPELFWAERPETRGDYPLLETHSEGMNRRVWATR